MRGAHVLRWGLLAFVTFALSATRGQSTTEPGKSSIAEIEKLNRSLAEKTEENAKLRAQNHDLEQHLLEMGKKLAELQGQLKLSPDKLVIPPINVPRFLPEVPLLPDGRPLPHGWSEQQFNGVPYYIIPLAHGQSPSGNKSR